MVKFHFHGNKGRSSCIRPLLERLLPLWVRAEGTVCVCVCVCLDGCRYLGLNHLGNGHWHSFSVFSHLTCENIWVAGSFSSQTHTLCALCRKHTLRHTSRRTLQGPSAESILGSHRTDELQTAGAPDWVKKDHSGPVKAPDSQREHRP